MKYLIFMLSLNLLVGCQSQFQGECCPQGFPKASCGPDCKCGCHEGLPCTCPG